MNKLFKTLIFCITILFLFSVSRDANATKRLYIQDTGYNVIAYLELDGTIYSNDNKIMGYINSDGSILNSTYGGIGYIEPDGIILNSSYKKIGCLNSDGTLLGPSFEPLAYIESSYVLAPSHSTMFYFDGPVSKKWIAAFYMFFYK